MALAIDGGTPVRAEPLPARIQMTDEELQAVVDLVKRGTTGALTFDRYGGEHVDAYEQEFADHVGTRFATAVSSGTAAIHAALGALRLDCAQEVISSPITDPGAVAPILWCNCVPIFADADPATMNMDPASFESRITDRTRAVVVGHIAGQPADMDPIMAIARKHDIVVIEDCSQSHDAVYRGKLVGSIGDLAAFSLMAGKHSTAGGQGGMVLTNNEDWYWNAKRFADRGKPFNSDVPGGMFLGLNYRMTELEAAIGRVQLRRLPDIIGRRRKAVAKLAEATADLEAVRLGKVIDGARSAYWFLLMRIEVDKLTVDKPQFVAALSAEGVGGGVAYDHIVYEQPWVRDRQTYGQSGCPWSCPWSGRQVSYEGSCPGARQAIDNHFVMGLHECYTEREAGDMAEALHKVEQAYLR